MISRLVLALTAALASCAKPPLPPPPGPVTFKVGYPYQSGGEWHYPKQFDSYDVTGLSTLIPDNTPIYTMDNEPYDPNALAAFSPVLQLPSIVTITNLVNGYTVDVRVNGRGPDQAGRVIAVTPHVAQLLNFPSDGVVEVEVKLNTQATAQLDGALGAGPKVTAAPVASITAQSLGAPGGASGTAQSIGPVASGDNAAQAPTLSGQVTIGQPAPGPLWVQIPGFGTEGDAARTMAELYGMNAQVVPTFGGDRTLWAVNIGPFHSVADADAALQQSLQRGVADPEIIVR